jgi:hypothetical protein
MEEPVDARLAAVFGSETRLRALGVLAGAFRPLTAYRVAKVGRIPVQKAYEELRRLGKSGLVVRKDGGWVLCDGDVRSLLRRRVRIRWAEDLEAERRHRRAEFEALFDRLERTPHTPPPAGWQPKDPGRFRRSPRKDRILRRMGRRTSVHA